MATQLSTLPPGREAYCMIHEGGQTFCIDPLVGPLQQLARRWTLPVVAILGNGTAVRFNEAKRAVPGITARALSKALGELTNLGLAARRVDATTSPPAVEYSLTRAGRSLRRALIPLIEWADAVAGGADSA